MNELLTALYDRFYDPYEDEALESQIDACHKELIQVLGKEEWKLVLSIIDNQDLLAERKSIDSFIDGFRLAWRLWGEVKETKGIGQTPSQ